MKILAALIMLLLSIALPAHAQQPPVSPEQAAAMQLGQQIGLLAHENGTLRMLLQRMQSEKDAAAKRVKELEDKYEPKPGAADQPAK